MLNEKSKLEKNNSTKKLILSFNKELKNNSIKKSVKEKLINYEEVFFNFDFFDHNKISLKKSNDLISLKDNYSKLNIEKNNKSLNDNNFFLEKKKNKNSENNINFDSNKLNFKINFPKEIKLITHNKKELKNNSNMKLYKNVLEKTKKEKKSDTKNEINEKNTSEKNNIKKIFGINSKEINEFNTEVDKIYKTSIALYTNRSYQIQDSVKSLERIKLNLAKKLTTEEINNIKIIFELINQLLDNFSEKQLKNLISEDLFEKYYKLIKNLKIN